MLLYAYSILADRVIVPRESFLLQWSVYAALLVFLVFLVLLILARSPRKLLVFDDALLVKFLSYRSTRLPYADIKELAVLAFPRVWLTRRIWKCVPLAIGVLQPGIFVRGKSGWAYYFNVRDREELLRVINACRPDPPEL